MGSAVIGALRVSLSLDSAAFSNGVEKVGKRMKTVGAQLQKVGAGLSAAVTLPLIGVGSAAIKMAGDAQKATESVRAALASMGEGAGYSLEQLQAMAAGLQKLSTFDDDEIMSKVTANLLTFGRVQGDVFAKAQQAALDLSARLGTDLQSSAIMLGKALNDPVKGISALTRVGVAFTEQQKEQIKAMAEAGNIAGAQAAILAELTKQYGGQAAALAATDPGQMTQAWNAIGDALEAVGAVILPILADMAVHVKSAAEAFSALSPETQRFTVIAAGVAAVLGPALIAVGLLATGIAAVGLPVAAVVVGIGAFTAAVVAFWPEIERAGQAINTFLDSIGDSARAGLASFGAAFVALKDQAVMAIEAMVTGIINAITGRLNAVWEGLASKIDWVKGKFAELYDAVVGHSYIPDMVTGVQDWMGQLGASFGRSIAGLVDGTMTWRDALAGLLKDLAQLAMSKFGGAGGGGFIGGLIQSVLGAGLPGFARGGSFNVGGSGGIDSKVVAFRATPGEQVDIRKPGNDNGGGVVVQSIIEDHRRSGAPVSTETQTGPNGETVLRTIIRDEVTNMAGRKSGRSVNLRPAMVQR